MGVTRTKLQPHQKKNHSKSASIHCHIWYHDKSLDEKFYNGWQMVSLTLGGLWYIDISMHHDSDCPDSAILIVFTTFDNNRG